MSLWTPAAPPSPLDAQLPLFGMTIAAAIEHYRTAAYDAEQRVELARAEQLRAVAHQIRGLVESAFRRWYVTTEHPC